MSASSPCITSLSPELVYEIARLLDFRGILALASTCRYLRDLYVASQELQYIADLDADGMLDNTALRELPYAERDAVLRTRRQALTQLRPFHRNEFKDWDYWDACDLAGGVLAHYVAERTPQFVLHWLPTRTTPARVVEFASLDFCVLRLVIDPAQDVLVFLEGNRGHNVLNVHLCALSAHDLGPHKHAARPIISYHIANPVRAILDLHLADTSLALFAGGEQSSLRIYDWPSGTQIFKLDALDFAAASLGIVIELYSVPATAFVFLSPRAFALVGKDKAKDTPVLYLVRLDGAHSALNTLNDAVVLRLPTPSTDTNIREVLVSTGSFAAPDPARAIHVLDPAERIHVIMLGFKRADEVVEGAALIVVRTEALLARLADREPRDTKWTEWGPGSSRVIEYGRSISFSKCPVSGSRIVFGKPYEMRRRKWYAQYLLDFNVRRIPPDRESRGEDRDSLAHSQTFVGHAGDVDNIYSWTPEPVAREQLAYVCTWLHRREFGKWDDVMLDDEHLIKRRVDEEWEQRRAADEWETVQTTVYGF